MPEGIEIEIYRRAALVTVGRRIARVDAPDAWFIKGGSVPEEVIGVIEGEVIAGFRRRGKLLLMDLQGGTRVGLRFGMTGKLIVDGGTPIFYLEYSTRRKDPAWDRFGLHFADGGHLIIHDPRRLGGVELDPDEDRLGVDVYTVTRDDIAERIAHGAVAIKARLLDQSRIAGIGNLLADEMLWRAHLDPARPAHSLSDVEIDTLHRSLTEVITQLDERGGSHTGDIQDARHREGQCPRCGAPMLRRTIGGRTTYSCSAEQQ